MMVSALQLRRGKLFAEKVKFMDPIAHSSIGLMAKPIAPKVPLLVLMAATQVPDILFFAFEAAGMENQAVTQMDFNQGLSLPFNMRQDSLCQFRPV
jgi:hypothetical protein